MNGLVQFVLLIMMLMIYGIGHWLYTEIHRRRGWEAGATKDRHEIRGIACQARAEQIAHNAILDQFPSARERHLRIVRHNREEGNGQRKTPN